MGNSIPTSDNPIIQQLSNLHFEHTKVLKQEQEECDARKDKLSSNYRRQCMEILSVSEYDPEIKHKLDQISNQMCPADQAHFAFLIGTIGFESKKELPSNLSEFCSNIDRVSNDSLSEILGSMDPNIAAIIPSLAKIVSRLSTVTDVEVP